jgi:hypothetical protein
MERHEFSAVPHSAGETEFAGYNYADYIPAVEMER